MGHQFKSQTDTEVIMAAYNQWGTAAFNRFEGMFAFALWDAQTQQLILARDATGIKPLYYKHSSTGLSFASEIRAMATLPNMQEDATWPVQLMAFGHLPEPVTTLQNVKPIPKGCFLQYSPSTNTVSLQSYKFYNYREGSNGFASAKVEVGNMLKAAVERHMIADVPVGVFLSGGIDSAIIAKLAADIKQKDLHFLSIYFNDDKYSEKKYQDILLAQLPGKGHQFLLTQQGFEAALPAAIAQMDMPCSDGLNTWFISRSAKMQGIKAVLSGIGADELFGGYPSFSRIAFAIKLQQLPAAAFATAKWSYQKKWHRLAYLRLQGVKGLYLFLRGHFTPLQIAQQLGATEKEVWDILEAAPVLPQISNLSQKNQASWLEFNLYMQNQLLRDADVMGMANGVEIRVPYLDTAFVQLLHGISSEVKYGGQSAKSLLIEAHKSILPEAIYKRPKMGFAFPFADWLTQSNYVAQQMQHANAATAAAYQQFTHGKLHWSQMLTLLHLQLRHAN